MRKIIPITTVVILCIWVATIIAVPKFFTGPQSVSDFGDMFGAVNALFSGLALAALVATLWLQQQDLSKQSEMQQEQSERLKQTAKIHALGALLNSYTQQIGLSR